MSKKYNKFVYIPTGEVILTHHEYSSVEELVEKINHVQKLYAENNTSIGVQNPIFDKMHFPLDPAEIAIFKDPNNPTSD